LAQIGARPLPARSLLVLLIVALLAAAHFVKRPELRAARHTRTETTQSTMLGRARVIDGDTIDITGTRVRLDGIDAPEMEQSCADPAGTRWSCGRAAARELRAHLAGQSLSCEASGNDRYERVLATCALPDGSDVNAWLVREGWALAYGFGGAYRAEEAEAQAARRGIWSGNFLPPWEWRRRHM
jgi:endonuclease YncB( thermonuclease family)